MGSFNEIATREFSSNPVPVIFPQVDHSHGSPDRRDKTVMGTNLPSSDCPHTVGSARVAQESIMTREWWHSAGVVGRFKRCHFPCSVLDDDSDTATVSGSASHSG